ncbi:diadenylate cyclase DacZ [Haladaptatus salinisoli]|uniref:diadenylate cyclase DacZ n=1 Tax=Haladaptatus salinisoli TaxID=2884876 RepID=UPI001D09C747|nr:diadenylate cyclase DacZ [Haladaptatus salinisoli]
MNQITSLFGEIIADIEATLLFSPSTTSYNGYNNIVNTVVIAEENEFDDGQFIELPIDFRDAAELFQFGITGALDQRYIEEGTTVICVTNLFHSDADSITRVSVDRNNKSELYDFFAHSRAKPSVIREVLKLAIRLGKQGQKGEPVGALFSIGDAGTVMNSSRSLSYNPFDQSHVRAGDPIMRVMLKEFSRLDGAYVISDSGKIVSAYRYLEPTIENFDIPKGLGTRHHAAAAITNETDAITIVLSESDSRVRGFKNGNMIFNINPEMY